MGGDHTGYAVLASASAGNDPELADLLVRRVALGDATKERDLFLRHRQTERSLEDRAPGVPCRAGEPRLKQAGIVHRLDDVHGAALALLAR